VWRLAGDHVRPHVEWTASLLSEPEGPGRHRHPRRLGPGHQITTEQQHEVVLLREKQYRDALADSCDFQKKYMSLPFEVPDASFKKTVAGLASDEGIRFSTPEGLAGLKPVLPDGTVTQGGQTHPADGNAAIVIAESARASELSRDRNIRIKLHGFGSVRAQLAHMPEAPIPAAQRALEAAGRTIEHMNAIKTHSPFAVNDVLFSRQTGVPLEKMNSFGCSLVWGHPQAPMGTRGVIELIEGAGAARRRIRPVHRLRGGRHGDGRRHRSRRSPMKPQPVRSVDSRSAVARYFV
jgi:acetyl-CoA acetyltransferase